MPWGDEETYPLNININEHHSDAKSFAINPYGELNGKITSIKVEDIARGLEFNWANGVWDNPPEVAVGSKTLIVGAVFTNIGNVSGKFVMTMIDDLGVILGQRGIPNAIPIDAGATTILRPYPIDMPDRTYSITVGIDP